MEVSAEDGVVNGKYGVCKAAIVEAAMASKLQLQTPLTKRDLKPAEKQRPHSFNLPPLKPSGGQPIVALWYFQSKEGSA